MKYLYLDTEFHRNDFTRRGLVSIGMVTDEAAYYAVNNDMDIQGIASDPEVGEWMTENVLEPHIPSHSLRRLRQDHPDVKPWAVISAEVDAFLKAACPTGNAKTDLKVVVDCGAQDMVRLHTLLANNDWSKFGPWVPQAAVDMYEIKRNARQLNMKLEDLPVQPVEEMHHALYDAEHLKREHDFLMLAPEV